MGSRSLTFGECANEVRDKVQPEDTNSVKYIGLEHIEQGTLHLNGFGSANDVSSTKSKFSKGDILFGKLRPYFRKVVRAPFDGVCSTDIWVVRSINKIDQDFLYYWMASQEFVDFSMQGSEGTKMPRAKWDHVSRHQIPFFTKAEQKAIAHILGSLDDKIELNRRMNETLEAMAQALFKSWFVDFDPVIDNALAAGNEIPGELRERADIREALGDAHKPLPLEFQKLFPAEFVYTDEMGWIPKGWKVVTLDALVDLIGGGTPKTSNEEYWNGIIPWYSVVDAPNTGDVFVIDTEKHVTELGIEKSSTKILPVGTTIISARGTVGKCAMVGESMTMNQSCYGIRGKKDISYSFVYYTIREKVADLQRGGHGSVFNTITRDTFKTIKIAFGEPELTGKLDDRIKPSFDRILANRFCSKTLSMLRDALLPKLLSGEIRVPDSEKLVEEN
ncbi:restriction endonuclease subunit S [bacterium]|nr:restriction endonuclease subunit S [bacterium]